MSQLAMRGWAVVALALLLVPSAAHGQFRRRLPGVVGAGGNVQLPYMFNDGAGTMWRVFNDGWFQEIGASNVYNHAAALIVNGNEVAEQQSTARFDAATGELVIESVGVGTVTVSRHISFDKEQGMLRYIDVYQNAQNQEQTLNVGVQTVVNFGVSAAEMPVDPAKKDKSLAWVAQTNGGQAVVELFAGKGARTFPAITFQPGGNVVQATLSLTLAPGKQLAFMHLHKVVPNQAAGSQFVTDLKEAKLLKSIPSALRRLIVNFPVGPGWIGDIDLLRGDALDVVELSTGDQLRGDLAATSYTLQTPMGPLTLGAEKIVGIVNVGRFHPRQLLVTSDGQVFGGRLADAAVSLRLSSGQVTPIPLNQISRVGYHKRAGEPEEWTFDRPMAVLHDGQRMVVHPLARQFDVSTRYGKLPIPLEALAGIAFQSDESNVHQVTLSDGSRFSGLLEAAELEVTLDATQQTIKLPVSGLVWLQLAPRQEPDDLAPSLRLFNGDALVGTLGGKLNIDTSFDTLEINANEVRSITRSKELDDVKITLWDGSVVSGQLRESTLNCQLRCGVAMSVAVSLLEEYDQPRPHPSATMMEKIKTLVGQLSANDWKERDRASAALLEMGLVAQGTLAEMRRGQPPEAQRALDVILQKLEAQRKKEKPRQ